MIVPENYPPTGSGGLGCGGDCGCHSCRKGLGDTANPTFFESIWSALSTTLPIGSTGIPVWVLVAAGLVAAASLMPKGHEYRRR
jgi:hypothetical protein